MNFNSHLNLKGSHAVFGASKSSWLRYTDEKMIEVYRSQYKKTLGTEIHEFAASQITLGHKVTSIKNLINNFETYIYTKYYDKEYDDISNYGRNLLKYVTDIQKETFETVKLYINDGIGFKMTPEQVLYYSETFFGTTDTICFRNNWLRIHDLKTGAIPAHIEQLMIYAAYFCLEYNIKPGDIKIELRIYQNAEIITMEPTVEDIVPIIDKIITSNKLINHIKEQED